MTATHVVLVGLSGTGKSTLAPLVAADLGVESMDLDRLVEADAGTEVADVFAREGEPEFRRRELAALRRALGGPPAVIAAGGGVATTQPARDALADAVEAGAATVVWLRADPAELAGRLRGTGETRPLLAGDAESALRRLAAERDPLHTVIADIVVEVGGRSPGEVAAEVVAALTRAAGPLGADRG